MPDKGFEFLVEANKHHWEKDGIKLYELNGRHAFTGPSGRMAYFYKGAFKFGFIATDHEKDLFAALRDFKEKIGLPLLHGVSRRREG